MTTITDESTTITSPTVEAVSVLDPQARRDYLFHSYKLLADRLARSKHRGMPRCVTLDDLQSAAYIGLLDACDRYDSTKHEQFPMFVRIRVMGEIHDYLRRCIYGGRTRNVHGWPLEVPVFGSRTRRTFPLEESLAQEDRRSEGDEFFTDLLKILPEKIRYIFRAYYIDGLTMKEVSVHVKLGESRVSQLISRYKKVLRQHWTNQESELWDSARSRHSSETFRLPGSAPTESNTTKKVAA